MTNAFAKKIENDTLVCRCAYMNRNLAFFIKGGPPRPRACCSAISLTKVSGLSRMVPQRRAAAQAPGKKPGGDIKSGYLAIGTYDLIIHAERASDDAMAKFLLSLASKGNVRATTVKVFSQEESDKIIAAVV